MAHLQKVVESLVRQGTRKDASSAVLPHWMTNGAEVAYLSERSGQVSDVVIDHISNSKEQVRFSFVADRRVWKAVAFQEIIAGRNPLRPRQSATSAGKVLNDQAIGGRGGDAAPNSAGEVVANGGDDFDTLVNRLEKNFAANVPAPRSHESKGPSLPKVPKKWRRPEVVDLETSPERTVQNLDPEPDPPPVADKDPYGLESASVAQVGTAGSGRNERMRSKSRSRSTRRRGKERDKDKEEGKDRQKKEKKRDNMKEQQRSSPSTKDKATEKERKMMQTRKKPTEKERTKEEKERETERSARKRSSSTSSLASSKPRRRKKTARCKSSSGSSSSSSGDGGKASRRRSRVSRSPRRHGQRHRRRGERV
eukprot:TRINITY_DN36464_c0_g1_i2.p1 TRINITY_DN36464_c0_g1~~TRINITY_DN36464_c0_g1_i2.p1  ORF type:complete len:388 (-),score=79.42 TRINITY_DN36464_c0_g1_i2:103-1200(-)